MSEARKRLILAAISAELQAQGGRVDPLGLATAIDRALDTSGAGGKPADAASSPKGAYILADEGRTPEELNASNDDGRG